MKYVINIDLDNPISEGVYADMDTGATWILSEGMIQKLIPLEKAQPEIKGFIKEDGQIKILTVQQWTPVQQNPERSGWYIVTKRFGNGETWIGTKWYSTAYGWNGDGILAWMELPEAYKEGE